MSASPTRRDNIGNLVVNGFVLIGILLVFPAVGEPFCTAAPLGVSREEMIAGCLGDR